MLGVPPKGQELRVGRYAIQGEIATGGMATVHYGRLVGPAGFTRGVAIKRLHPQYAKDPDFVAMFLDEARLASRILHPNVVPILDVVSDGGELFLVMEFVPGESLSKLVKRTPEGVPVSIALSIAVGVLEGLHAAHEARGDAGEQLLIVHRDVSPQNLLIGLDAVARLIDFGVAKATGNSTATRDGQLKGKVAYMSPEQIQSEPVDRRADIYAATVVLWEMLTGKRFFGEAESDAARMLRALSADPPPPPSRERPELAAELDAIVLRGLAKSRRDRFSTAREMAQALERFAAPAAARDVARWVEAKAGEALWLRTQKFNEFDPSIATELPGLASTAALKEPRDLTSPTLSASSLVTAGKQGARRAKRSRTGLFVAIAIAVAGSVGFYAARWVEPGRSTTAVGLEPPPPPAPAPTATLEPTAEAPRADAPPPSAEPTALAQPPTRPAGGGARVAVPLRNPPAGNATGAAKAPKPGCSPPYHITADGLKKYKPECLK